MDGYRGDLAGMGDLGLSWSDLNPLNVIKDATTAVVSAVTPTRAPDPVETAPYSAARAAQEAQPWEGTATYESPDEIMGRWDFQKNMAQAFGDSASSDGAAQLGRPAGGAQVLTNSQGQTVDSFAIITRTNYRALSPEGKQHIVSLWDEIEAHLHTAGATLPRVWDKPMQEWAAWGYDKGCLVVPVGYDSNKPRPDFLQVETLAQDDGTTQVNGAAIQLWQAFVKGPVKEVVTGINAVWVTLGQTDMAAAQARVDSANLLLRCVEAVATLGLSELAPIIQAKWADMKAKYADFRAKVKQYNDLMNNPSISAKDKEAARASAGPIVDKVSALFSDQSSGKSLDQRLNEESGASAVAGLGFIAALPAIWAGIQITGVVIAIGILVWAIAKLWPIIKMLIDLLAGLNKMTGGLLIPALIVGGVGWFAWRKFGGKAKSLFAKG